MHVACLRMPLAPVKEEFLVFSPYLSHEGRDVYTDKRNTWWSYLGVGKIQWYWFIFHKVYSYRYITKVKNITVPWLNNFWKTFHIISPENSVFIWILEGLKNPNSRILHFLFYFAFLCFTLHLPFILQIHLIIKCFL